MVQPDYVLSVNPGSVREDADATTVTVRVKTGNGVAVDADTYVLLSVSTEGLNTRFRITLPTLKIPQGGTDAEGTITFTPIPNMIEGDDLPIMITGNAGANDIVGATEIKLVDDDKTSTEVNLSFSQASLSKRDGTTEIVVTATLNGKTLGDDLRFSLTIDKDFCG